MKLKIISGNNYELVEVEVNEFIAEKEVDTIVVTETYHTGFGASFLTYNIFFQENDKHE